MARGRIRHEEAIDYILSHGWKPCYPVESVPMIEQYFWDGINERCGYAWLAAVEEIQRREKARMQPNLFEVIDEDSG